jgi:hypothetical protein
MALFRSSKSESRQHTLTKDLEDVSAQELLEELRELRQQLGITGPVAVEPES